MAKGEDIAATGTTGNIATDKTQSKGSPHQSSDSLIAQGAENRGPSSLFRRLFSFNSLLAFLLLGAVVGSLYINTHIFEGDTWWHLVAGEQILKTHTWPTKDQYSFTAAGDKWIAYEWGGEVVMAVASRLGGLRGLALLYVILVSLVALLMFSYAYSRSRNGKAAFIACGLLLPLTTVTYTVRPKLLGQVFLLVTLILLDRYRHGRQKNLWILPALFVVWVNTHGTFAFGIVFLVVYWVSGLMDLKIGGISTKPWTDRERRHLGVVTLLSFAALAVTPYGTELAARYVTMSFSQPLNLASFQEWQPPDFTNLYGKVFLAILLLFLIIPFILRLECRLEEVVLVIIGVFAGCIHVRFGILFAILLAPFLATLIAPYMPAYDPNKDKPLLNLALMALVVVVCVRVFPSRSKLVKTVSESFPTGAVKYIRQHPSVGPIFNNEYWGGYLIKELGPQRKVFIDGRADLYEPAGLLSDYISIMRLAPNTTFLLRKYHVNACLIPLNSPLAIFLTRLPDWRRVYSGSISVMFVHETKAPPGTEKETPSRKT